MAKKKDITWKDWFFWYGSVLGSLFVLVSCVPKVPWRSAKVTPAFGQRFLPARTMGLFTVSNQYSQDTAWFKMQSEVCKKEQEFNRPNPLSAGLALGSMVMSSNSDGAMTTGGAVLGCAAWPVCKEAVATRCSAYMTVATVGLVAFLLMLCGAISAAMGIIFMAKEAHVKKKKKKEEAQWNTALAGIWGFVLAVSGTLLYVTVTDMMFKSLQANSHYPFPGAYVGIYLAAFGEVLLFLAMVCGIRRQDYYQEEQLEEEEEVYAPDVGDVPPGMSPAPYGMQPGMMQPGMMPPGGAGYPAYPGMAPPVGGMPGQTAPPPPMYAR